MVDNKLKVGLGLLTVLATPIAVNVVSGSEVHAAEQKTAVVEKSATAEKTATESKQNVAEKSAIENKQDATEKPAVAEKSSVTEKSEVAGKLAEGETETDKKADVANKVVTDIEKKADEKKQDIAYREVPAKKDKTEEKKVGWTQTGNVWYYFNTKGQQVKNAWVGSYWLGSDGKMVTNSWVDGGKYYVGNEGWYIPNYKLSVPALNMPQYYQSDARWGRKVYGIANMTRTGCVPTALAMAFSGLGKPVTPVNVADVIYYNTKEFNVSMIGTSGAGADYAIKHYNFKNTVIKSKEQLVQALHSGNPVFALVGNGDFVRGYAYTHGIMLSGYQNGKTKAMDPDSAYNTNKWYNVDRIWDQRSTDPYDTMLGGSFMLIEKK